MAGLCNLMSIYNSITIFVSTLIDIRLFLIGRKVEVLNFCSKLYALTRKKADETYRQTVVARIFTNHNINIISLYWISRRTGRPSTARGLFLKWMPLLFSNKKRRSGRQDLLMGRDICYPWLHCHCFVRTFASVRPHRVRTSAFSVCWWLRRCAERASCLHLSRLVAETRVLIFQFCSRLSHGDSVMSDTHRLPPVLAAFESCVKAHPPDHGRQQ